MRVLPKLIAGGLFQPHPVVGHGGLLLSPGAKPSPVWPPQFGNSAGSELLIGAAIAYASLEHRFAIGPEAVYSATVLGENALQPQTMSLDLLLPPTTTSRILQVGGGRWLRRCSRAAARCAGAPALGLCADEAREAQGS